jgi:hypothetical protein
MTEDEWLECTDLEQMLLFLEQHASERKLRLFSCGCWYSFTGRGCQVVAGSIVQLHERRSANP